MDDAAVAETAATAAESVVFSRYDRTEIEDLDVTVQFAEGQLDVDVYLNVPGDEAGAQRAAEDAALAARGAVDDLLG